MSMNQAIKPVQAPCKDCGDRTIECHGKCEKYLAFRKSNEEMNKYQKAQRMVDYYIIESCKAASNRRMKSNGC